GAAVGGNYTVSVMGRSGTLSHSVIISVMVSDFTVSASTSVSFNSGASNPQTGVTIGAINHLTGSITLLPSVSPSGLSVTGCSPNPVALNSTVTSTISICAFRSTTPGTYTVTMKGSLSATSLSRSFALTVNVGDYSISAAGRDLNVGQTNALL